MKTKIINRTVNYPASHAILLLQYLGMQSLFVRNFVFLYFMDPILGFLGIEDCRIEGAVTNGGLKKKFVTHEQMREDYQHRSQHSYRIYPRDIFLQSQSSQLLSP